MLKSSRTNPLINLNNVVEHDHRAIKRRIRPMLGFKSFRCARIRTVPASVFRLSGHFAAAQREINRYRNGRMLKDSGRLR